MGEAWGLLNCRTGSFETGGGQGWGEEGHRLAVLGWGLVIYNLRKWSRLDGTDHLLLCLQEACPQDASFHPHDAGMMGSPWWGCFWSQRTAHMTGDIDSYRTGARNPPWSEMSGLPLFTEPSAALHFTSRRGLQKEVQTVLGVSSSGCGRSVNNWWKTCTTFLDSLFCLWSL